MRNDHARAVLCLLAVTSMACPDGGDDSSTGSESGTTTPDSAMDVFGWDAEVYQEFDGLPVGLRLVSNFEPSIAQGARDPSLPTIVQIDSLNPSILHPWTMANVVLDPGAWHMPTVFAEGVRIDVSSSGLPSSAVAPVLHMAVHCRKAGKTTVKATLTGASLGDSPKVATTVVECFGPDGASTGASATGATTEAGSSGTGTGTGATTMGSATGSEVTGSDATGGETTTETTGDGTEGDTGMETTGDASEGESGMETTGDESDASDTDSAADWAFIRIVDIDGSARISYIQQYDGMQDNLSHDVLGCNLGSDADPEHADCQFAVGAKTTPFCEGEDTFATLGTAGELVIEPAIALKAGHFVTVGTCDDMPNLQVALAREDAPEWIPMTLNKAGNAFTVPEP